MKKVFLTFFVAILSFNSLYASITCSKLKLKEGMFLYCPKLGALYSPVSISSERLTKIKSKLKALKLKNSTIINNKNTTSGQSGVIAE